MKYREITPLLIVTMILPVIVYWAYAPALSGPLLLDDHYSVVNSKIDEFSISNIIGLIVSDNSSEFQRPLSLLSFSINHLFYYQDTYPLKIINLVIHILNSLLVYIVCKLILTRLVLSKRIGYSLTEISYLSLFVSAIWVLHPLLVSTNMYVVQRMASLSAFFTMLSFALYIVERNRVLQGIGFRKKYLILSLGSIILGFLAKENAVLILLYIFVLELCLYDKNQGLELSLLNSRVFNLTVLCISILVVGATVYFADGLLGGYAAREFSLWERVLTQIHVMLLYVSLILVPNIDTMTFYWDHYPITKSLDTRTLLLIIFYLFVLVVSIIKRKSNPIFCFGVLFFIASHALESTIFPLELVFEHRNYIGLFGVSLVVTCVIYDIAKKYQLEKMWITGLFLIIVVLSFQTRIRAIEWSHPLTFSGLSAERSPGSMRATDTYVVDLMMSGRWDEADRYLHSLLDSSELKTNYLMRKIHTQSVLGRFDEKHYKQLVVTLKNERLSSQEINTLSNLQDSVYNGAIPELGLAELETLFNVALSNSEKRVKGDAEAVLVDRYVDLLIKMERNQEAIVLSKIGYTKWPNNRSTLLRYAEMYYLFHDVSEDRALYEKILSTNYKKTVLKERYDMLLEELQYRLTAL